MTEVVRREFCMLKLRNCVQGISTMRTLVMTEGQI